ncbi:hypothetical protein [Azospirillum argentinense]
MRRPAPRPEPALDVGGEKGGGEVGHEGPSESLRPERIVSRIERSKNGSAFASR